MNEHIAYLSNILSQTEKPSDSELTLLKTFSETEEVIKLTETVKQAQKELMNKWQTTKAKDAINQLNILLPNAMEGKPYTATLPAQQLKDLGCASITVAEPLPPNLTYQTDTHTITGTPTTNGTFDIILQYELTNEPNTPNQKQLKLLINPDPKKLWKNINSNESDIFWKEDVKLATETIGERNIVAASKRGRSHANAGTFRDDDFAYTYLTDSGWTIVAVSDGAGSHSMSRKGSELACNGIVNYFSNNNTLSNNSDFGKLIATWEIQPAPENFKPIEVAAKQMMYRATAQVHTEIKTFAEQTFAEHPELFTNPAAKSYLEYFHATLVFTLFKKLDDGYLVLSFGVGDSPAAALDTTTDAVTLLNWLDVGEYGGGTRFVTQPEIFQKQEVMVTRFKVMHLPNFTYLLLMTDGIYDPKFIVEANLEKPEYWKQLMADLNGHNEECTQVIFDPTNTEIANQLSNWMDFWSPGNHDDRTLVIVY